MQLIQYKHGGIALERSQLITPVITLVLFAPGSWLEVTLSIISIILNLWPDCQKNKKI